MIYIRIYFQEEALAHPQDNSRPDTPLHRQLSINRPVSDFTVTNMYFSIALLVKPVTQAVIMFVRRPFNAVRIGLPW